MHVAKRVQQAYIVRDLKNFQQSNKLKALLFRLAGVETSIDVNRPAGDGCACGYLAATRHRVPQQVAFYVISVHKRSSALIRLSLDALTLIGH